MYRVSDASSLPGLDGTIEAMQYRHVATLLLLTACEAADPTAAEPEPDLTELTGAAGAPATATVTDPATSCPVCPAPAKPTVCPAPAAAPSCPAQVECPAPVTCPAPAAPTECPDPYPTMPTTYGAADAWPVPTDHPHGLSTFCHVTIPTLELKRPDGTEGTTVVDVGCGEVNDPRWNHLNIRYSQTRTRIDPDTGAISQVTSERGCYGPHGADAADTCVAGTKCYVDYWIPTSGLAMRTAWGTCLAR